MINEERTPSMPKHSCVLDWYVLAMCALPQGILTTALHIVDVMYYCWIKGRPHRFVAESGRRACPNIL